MKSHALVASLVLLMGAPVLAQSSSDMQRQRDAELQRAAQREAEAQRIFQELETLGRRVAAGEVEPAAAEPLMEQYRARIEELEKEAGESRERAGGMTGEIAKIEEANREANSTSGNGNGTTNGNGNGESGGFMSKVGEKLLEVGGTVAGSLLQRIISGGATNEDRELFSQLVAQRDAALAEANNIQDGSNPYGNPIYDANGNIIGWDRDGDGAQDLADTDGNGEPDSWNGGTNTEAYDEFGGIQGQPEEIYQNGVLAGYDTNGDGVVDIPVEQPSDTINSSGGGASGGNTIGGSIGSGGTTNSKDDKKKKKDDDKKKKKKDEDDDDKKKKKDDDDKKDDDKKDDDKKEELAATQERPRVRTGARAAAAANLQNVRGRLIVTPKPDPTRAGVFGQQRAGQQPYGATGGQTSTYGQPRGQYGAQTTPTTPTSPRTSGGARSGGQQGGGDWWNSDPAPTADTWNDKDNGDVPSEWGQFNDNAWGNQGGAKPAQQPSTSGGNTWGSTPSTPTGRQPQGSTWGQPQAAGAYGAQPQQPAYGGYNPYQQPAPGTYGYGYQQPAMNLAQLAEQLSSIDGVIEQWRQVERQRSGFGTPAAGSSSAYGYQGSGASTRGTRGTRSPRGARGNRRSGAARYGQEVDELAQFRTKDGLLDMTKVDVWVIADDPHSGRASWKENQPGQMPIAPIRFKVQITAQALETFEAIQGGYVVVKGVVAPMNLPPQMLHQVQGQVLNLTVHQWLGTTKTPPIRSTTTQPGAPGARRTQFDDF